MGEEKVGEVNPSLLPLREKVADEARRMGSTGTQTL